MIIMKERIDSFKKYLTNIEDDNVFDSVTTFSKMIAEDFKSDFPEYPASVYQNNPLWQMMIGSSLPEDYVDTTPDEVQTWLEGKLAEFLDTAE